MRLHIVCVLAVCACGDAAPAEQYGFVALLGRDTVSVERITRSATRLVTDGVDRFPYVRQRHTEFDLSPDGRIRRMVMDVRTPSGATPAERGRRITADISNDGVRISVRDSAGVRDTAFKAANAIIVPHVSMMYSVIELEVAAALRRAADVKPGERITFRQFYPDRDVGPSFTLHQGGVLPQGDGKVELQHDWLAGAGDLTVDSAGRMMTYSGMRSTYKVAVSRTTELPDVESIGARFAQLERRVGAAQLSVRDTTRATIGAATISVDYSRPLARGRTLLGDVIPYDRVWRTGANAATQLTTTAPISLAGVALAPGTYTLWTVPHQDGAELIVNSQIGQWGTGYGRAHDLGRAPMQTRTLADTIERFTIGINPEGAARGELSLSWGTFRWSAPIDSR